MPAVSKQQFRFLQALAHEPGKMKNKPEGMSPAQAQEFINATPSYKELPKYAAPRVAKRFTKLI